MEWRSVKWNRYYQVVDMKNLSKYIVLLFAVAMASCEKVEMKPADIELIPEAGYIRFSTGVATKAPIIEDMKGRNFGVLGYEYGLNTSWQVARALATPQTFYNQIVSCAANGVCSYDPIKKWGLAKKYSFFAYYPLTGESDGKITVSESTAVNMPKVTYNLPLVSSASGSVNPDELLDLMTAYSIDQTAGAGQVGFTFQHRLFCVEVLAQNFNTENVVTDAEGNEIEIDADEYISDLRLTIDNLKYKGITVPMHKGDSNPVMTANDLGSVQFSLLSAAEEIKVPSRDENVGEVSLCGPDADRLLMLVPQSGEKMTGKAEFILKNSQGVTQQVSLPFEANMNFIEGTKYQLTISFTGASIVIAMAEAGGWVSKPVNYDFE